MHKKFICTKNYIYAEDVFDNMYMMYKELICKENIRLYPICTINENTRIYFPYLFRMLMQNQLKKIICI